MCYKLRCELMRRQTLIFLAMSDEFSTDRETLITDSIIPQILPMTSFLGNLDFPDNFRQYQADRTSNYAFREARSDDVQLVVLFGEVAPYLHGTKLGAIGNHYRGKPGEVRTLYII